jgi:hypothetical protein
LSLVGEAVGAVSGASSGTVQAVQHVRRMRGGAQSHLMRCDDDHFYVVKFQNNPQHRRVLANELLATLLAESVGLPVPRVRVVEVGEWLIRNTPELHVQLAGESLRCEAGRQFGSRFVVDPMEGQVYDYLPDELLTKVKNLDAFRGMLCLDKWTCNSNGRQAVFWKKLRERNYKATFIDQGYCFNAGEWSFPDSPLRGVYARNLVYQSVSGWESFEPWLGRIEAMEMDRIAMAASEVPSEWYGEWDEMEKLVAALHHRRGKLRELIRGFRGSSRQPFPNWKERSVTVN